MDLELLPHGKFRTRTCWFLELSKIASNILRMIDQKALAKKKQGAVHAVQRRRHRTVINNLVNMACHVAGYARQMVIGLDCSNVWWDVFFHSTCSVCITYYPISMVHSKDGLFFREYCLAISV